MNRQEPYTRLTTLVFHRAIELTASDIEQLKKLDKDVKFKGDQMNGFTEIEIVCIPQVGTQLMQVLCSRPTKR